MQTTVQVMAAFIKDGKILFCPTKFPNRIVKSKVPFPRIQARLLNIINIKAMFNPSYLTSRHGPTFSSLDIPMLPDNNETQKFNVKIVGNIFDHVMFSAGR